MADGNLGQQQEAFFFKQEGFSTPLTHSSLLPESVNRLKLHATTGYSFSSSSTMTTQPVSDGSDRADHYTNNVDNIRLSGVIADHINPFRFNRSEEKTSRDYVEEIKRLKNTKQRITVILPNIGYFENCMITSFTPSRRTATGLGTEVNITFQKLLVATIGNTRKVALTEKDLTEEEKNSGSIEGEERPDEVQKNLRQLQAENSIENKIEYAGKIEAKKQAVETLGD